MKTQRPDELAKKKWCNDVVVLYLSLSVLCQTEKEPKNFGRRFYDPHVLTTFA